MLTYEIIRILSFKKENITDSLLKSDISRYKVVTESLQSAFRVGSNIIILEEQDKYYESKNHRAPPLTKIIKFNIIKNN